ncbi:zinc phosphodiesterase ELAC protein 2 [Hyla sarda]|uniref:zinc phosphodiesterase ELAC protein 2 n=1 Tax=Hyla sarda TaxID=327740 RepID=UPI0024C2AFE6|nr:zinc phosphodiesterase ELAC protein 2 [Hyla sarda]
MGVLGLLWRRLSRLPVMAEPGARAYSMKKNKAPKEPLRHIKNRARQEERHSPAVVYVQVVAAGSRDVGASVYLFSDHNRYLFNCGEGAQRLMHENKVKLSRLDNVFITRMDWANVGGLSGVLLTLRDVGLPNCLVSGPPQLTKFLQAIKTYCGPMEGMTVDVRPYTDPLYSDETMCVTQVPVFSSNINRESPPKSPSPKPETIECESEPKRRRVSPDLRTRSSNRSPPCVIAYVCKLHDRKGHFLVLKAKEIGLPVGTREIGPIITDLKAGKSVTYEGREVSPADVLSPDIPGPTFIVVECPSEDFITPVTENAAWKSYQEDKAETAAALVIHMTPEHILNNRTYRQWMERFGPGTEHLLLNEDTSTVHNVSSYKIQSQLHLIHPEIFPQLPDIHPKNEASDVPGVRAESLLRYHLRPKVEWHRDQVAQNQTSEFVKEAMDLPDFGMALEECRRLLQSDGASTKEGARQYPEVVFLGTGSAIPMKTRNVSGTLVHVSPSALMLLDCGEGTFGQLHRHYGDAVDDVLSRLSAVFISHIHADHHTGLLRVVLERERALASLGKPFSPVLVIGPTTLMTWLNQYNDHCQQILHNICFIPSRSLTETSEVDCPKTLGLISSLLKMFQLEKFQTCFVRHCKNAFGCAIVHQSGWKLVFSGDTMPCDALIKMGKDASLVIHEATLEDGLEQDAIEKAHSTTSQAIAVAMNMNAEFMMLNHFSQRYAKLPLMSDAFSSKVGISFDHMRIRLSDLQTLPKLMGPLKALFAENLEELEERKQKRELRLLEETESAPSDSKTAASSVKRELDDTNMAADVKRLKAN